MKICSNGLLLSIALSLGAGPALGAESCRNIFAAAKTGAEWRASLNHQLTDRDVPHFLKATAIGDLPVVLANARTTPALAELMNHSLGVQVLLQPVGPYMDHGMLRLGGVRQADGTESSVQIDWGLPGGRSSVDGGNDELHKTGLAWRSVDERLALAEKKGRMSLKTIEATFIVTEDERENLEYYHRVRRAGIFARSSLDLDGVMQPQLPNMMVGFENCFVLCRGSQFTGHIFHIVDHIRSYGIYNVDEVMDAPESRHFLAEARKQLMNAPWWTGGDLAPAMLHDEPAVAALSPILPSLVKNPDGTLRPSAYTFVNWMVALDATRGVAQVYKDLGVADTFGVGSDLNNPRVAAILIYDAPEAAPRFVDATYSAPGKFDDSGWGEGVPAGSRPYSDQKPAHPARSAHGG